MEIDNYINNLITYHVVVKSYFLFEKSIEENIRLIDRYEIMHHVVWYATKMSDLDDNITERIIKAMLESNCLIINKYQYDILRKYESFQFHSYMNETKNTQTKRKLGFCGKIDGKERLPKNRFYGLYKFRVCWDNKCYFLVHFNDNSYKIYYHNTIHEIVFPKGIKKSIVTNMLSSFDTCTFSNEEYNVIHEYDTYKFKYGPNCYNSHQIFFGIDENIEVIIKKIITDNKYFLVERTSRTDVTLLEKYAIHWNQTDGSFEIDLNEKKIEQIIESMLKAKCMLLNNYQYNIILEYDTYHSITKIQESKYKNTIFLLFKKIIFTIKGFLGWNSINDFSNYWTDRYYFLRKVDDNNYLIYYKNTMKEIYIPNKFRSVIINNMLELNCMTLSNEAYIVINNYEKSKINKENSVK